MCANTKYIKIIVKKRNFAFKKNCSYNDNNNNNIQF